jgi:catechol 2,3-dioxygenase
MALRGINHVVLKVRELERSRRFYERLGFQQVGQRPRMIFFRAGGHPHDLALWELGPGAVDAPRQAVGLFHFCVTVESEADLAELHSRMVADGHPIVQVVDHVASRSFYVRDPDGNMLEITYDVPEAEWAHLDNPFGADYPYDLPKRS